MGAAIWERLYLGAGGTAQDFGREAGALAAAQINQKGEVSGGVSAGVKIPMVPIEFPPPLGVVNRRWATDRA